jgi:propanediol dehydratase small subunit
VPINSMYGAELTGNYIREAAEVYRNTGLLKMED